MFFPVVQFRARDGARVEARALTGATIEPVAVGQAVEVVYDLGDPRRFDLAVAPSGLTSGAWYRIGGGVAFTSVLVLTAWLFLALVLRVFS
ncbi:MAG: hypothetical protein QM621_10250 [Aeromicrobium sp.]